MKLKVIETEDSSITIEAEDGQKYNFLRYQIQPFPVKNTFVKKGDEFIAYTDSHNLLGTQSDGRHLSVYLKPEDLNLSDIKFRSLVLSASKIGNNLPSSELSSELFFKIKEHPGESCPTIDPVKNELQDIMNDLKSLSNKINSECKFDLCECEECSNASVLEDNESLGDDLSSLANSYYYKIEEEMETFEKIREINSSVRENCIDLKSLIWDKIQRKMNGQISDEDTCAENASLKSFEERVSIQTKKSYQISLGQRSFFDFRSLRDSGVRMSGGSRKCDCENFRSLDSLEDKYKEFESRLEDLVGSDKTIQNYEQGHEITYKLFDYFNELKDAFERADDPSEFGLGCMEDLHGKYREYYDRVLGEAEDRRLRMSKKEY